MPKDSSITGPVMLWVAGELRYSHHFNDAWLEFRGRTLDQECGSGWIDGIHPEDRESAALVYNVSYSTRQAFTLQFRLKRFDGIYRSVLDTGVPLQLSDGSFAGFVGGCIDVTEQRESEVGRTRLSALLISAQEVERASIARELHDHIS